MSETNPAGRPPKKNPAVLEKILSLKKEGKTQTQIAEIVGISDRTLRLWRDEDWEFSASLKEYEQMAVDVVEMTTFQKAIGYSHPEEKIFCNEGEIIRAETTKHYPPDTQAAIFWLTNRCPDRWKVRKEEEHKVLVLKQEIVSSLSTEELLQETEKLMKSLKSENVQDPIIDGE